MSLPPAPPPDQKLTDMPALPNPDVLRQHLEKRRYIPRATYRLQFHKGFTLRDATALIDYLDRLGISDVYASPILQARPGSMHGYDITDHHKVNREIGSEADFDAFSAALRERQMGLIIDFVPNHMAADPENNPWWRDVLENGPCSPHARFFDIDWNPVKAELQGKVLLPILGDQYGNVLYRGELKVEFREGWFCLRYYERRLPVNPQQLPLLLKIGLDHLRTDLKPSDPHLREFLSILTALSRLPALTEKDPDLIDERQREKEICKDRLRRLAANSPRISQHITEAITEANGTPNEPASFQTLHQFLDQQGYRLASWRTASHEINYRRFFDVNDLAALRMENPIVFAETHPLVLRWIRQGKITGIRLDHSDGLYNPAGYFETLQNVAFYAGVASHFGRERNLSNEERQTLDNWRQQERARDIHGASARPLYIVAEKILTGAEPLPEDWAIDGTSGYDGLNFINGLFVDTKAQAEFIALYHRVTRKTAPFEIVMYVSKRLIMSTSMASELNVLAHYLNRISEFNPRSRDYTLQSLRDALLEFIACFPVYRTYISATTFTETDRQVIGRTIARAKRRNPALEPSIFDFLREVLSPSGTDFKSAAEAAMQLDFRLKLQQYTGPVQAKGLEDTAFYRQNVLLSLNEVGGDPRQFGLEPEEFHRLMGQRVAHWPHTMVTTATHDTKRGEDARARINVLSEIPKPWEDAVREWFSINAPCREKLENGVAPDANDEYMFYQALVGAYPAEGLFTEEIPDRASLIARTQEYMQKALKEAKLNTSWINPNELYEQAVARFVETVLSGPNSERFLKSFLPFVRKVALGGAINSLAQLTLKAAMPGVPDFYQGTELWDLSFVDPDNRRPVDYSQRTGFLKSLDLPEGKQAASFIEGLLRAWPDGRIKMFLIHRLLHFRNSHSGLFREGNYTPIAADGPAGAQVVAFQREHESERVLVLVPRLCFQFGEGSRWPTGQDWEGTTLSIAGSWTNVITGESLPAGNTIQLSAAFASFPVAMLYSRGQAK